MAVTGVEDKEAGEEAKVGAVDMARKPHGWAPKEDGPNSNNTVVMAADVAVDAEANVAANMVAHKESDTMVGAASTKVFNQFCSNKTTTGATAGCADTTCRSDTTKNMQ